MGYKKFSAESIISVSPINLEGELDEIIFNQVCKDYEGKITKETGLVISIIDLLEHDEGEIVPGDSNVFFKVKFEFLSYYPKLHELVKGKVAQATDFGAFINIGPLEALCHISQVMDDFNSYNSELPGFVGKETKQILTVEDEVLARIANISLKDSLADCKIGLTMRQLGLGKEEWIESTTKKNNKKTKKTTTKKTKKESKKNK
jgi:DNA-directed RNA polymerase subunit E'